MKNLAKKLVAPLVFLSALSLNSIDSKAQDFLPGKFKNYSERKVLVGAELEILDAGVFFLYKYYDVDSNSFPDVVECVPLTVRDGKLIEAENPCAYYLDLDTTKTYLKMFYDPKMDGWNNNEEFISGEEIDYASFNL